MFTRTSISGLMAMLVVAATAGATPIGITQVFTAPASDFLPNGLAIPDDQYIGPCSLDACTAHHTLMVPELPGWVVEVEAAVWLDHAFIGDVTVLLEGPDGTRITLLNRPGVCLPDDGSDTGGASADFDGARKLVFDDDWPSRPAEMMGGGMSFFDVIPATEYADPPQSAPGFDPPYKPDPDTADDHATLSAFDGRAAGGSWTIYIGDSGPLLEGALRGWEVKITTVPEPGTLLPALLLVLALGLSHRPWRARIAVPLLRPTEG